MRIAICDDSELDRLAIIGLLTQYFSDKPQSFHYHEFSAGTNLLHEIRDGYTYDVVILDIYMENHLGIDVARELRQLSYKGAIVFLTSSSEFAVDSYDVNAQGYLLKPHSYEKLCRVMDHIMASHEIDSYPVKHRNHVIRIPYHEIRYIESDNAKCLLHRSNNEVYTIYKKLDIITKELKDSRFLRCHQSYLVNMAHVQSADTKFTLINGETIMIRQRELKVCRAKYFTYMEQKRHE